MEIKMIELRDHATFISCIAIKMSTPNVNTDMVQRERWLLERAGYSLEQSLIAFGPADFRVQLQYSPYNWGRSDRTYSVAHQYLMEHWDDIRTGDLLDVEFILGETNECKHTEMVSPSYFDSCGIEDDDDDDEDSAL